MLCTLPTHRVAFVAPATPATPRAVTYGEHVDAAPCLLRAGHPGANCYGGRVTLATV